MALCSGLPGQASQNQKGKTNLDYTEATDTEWQGYQLGSVRVCTLLQTDNHASTPPLCFFSATQATVSKHWRNDLIANTILPLVCYLLMWLFCLYRQSRLLSVRLSEHRRWSGCLQRSSLDSCVKDYHRFQCSVCSVSCLRNDCIPFVAAASLKVVFVDCLRMSGLALSVELTHRGWTLEPQSLCLTLWHGRLMFSDVLFCEFPLQLGWLQMQLL